MSGARSKDRVIGPGLTSRCLPGVRLPFPNARLGVNGRRARRPPLAPSCVDSGEGRDSQSFTPIMVPSTASVQPLAVNASSAASKRSNLRIDRTHTHIHTHRSPGRDPINRRQGVVHQAVRVTSVQKQYARGYDYVLQMHPVGV